MRATNRFAGWPLVGYCGLLLLLVSVVRFGMLGTGEEGLRAMVRFTAQLSLVLFSAAFTASSLHALWPRSDWAQWLRANRRYLGVSFARDEGLRFTHRARLYPLFEAAFASKTAADLTPAFDAGGVTWGSYQTLEAALNDTRLFKDNPLFEAVKHPSGLTYPAPGAMGTIPQDVRGPVTPAPKLGQHTDEVLAEVLGLSGGEIAKLHDGKVVAGPS